MGKYGTGKHITNSESCTCGSMICHECKEDIKGDYLIVEHYESKRGNEDDYNELFCFKCSKDQKVWSDFFNEQDELKKEQEDLELREKMRNCINAAKRIEFSENENGVTTIIVY